MDSMDSLDPTGDKHYQVPDWPARDNLEEETPPGHIGIHAVFPAGDGKYDTQIFCLPLTVLVSYGIFTHAAADRLARPWNQKPTHVFLFTQPMQNLRAYPVEKWSTTDFSVGTNEILLLYLHDTVFATELLVPGVDYHFEELLSIITANRQQLVCPVPTNPTPLPMPNPSGARISWPCQDVPSSRPVPGYHVFNQHMVQLRYTTAVPTTGKKTRKQVIKDAWDAEIGYRRRRNCLFLSRTGATIPLTSVATANIPPAEAEATALPPAEVTTSLCPRLTRAVERNENFQAE